MNVQIFGLKKCADTRKAQRFFKERGIRFQFIDLSRKGLSKGELRSVAVRVPLASLLDRTGSRFLEKGFGSCVPHPGTHRKPAAGRPVADAHPGRPATARKRPSAIAPRSGRPGS